MPPIRMPCVNSPRCRNASKCCAMVMPKLKSIGIASTPWYFYTFCHQYHFYNVKAYLFYIRATVLALLLSAFTMPSGEKQKSAATFYTVGYFTSTMDHQSTQMMVLDLKHYHIICYSQLIANIQCSVISS